MLGVDLPDRALFFRAYRELRQRDLQHAVLELSFRVCHIHLLRQRHHAAERALRDLVFFGARHAARRIRVEKLPPREAVWWPLLPFLEVRIDDAHQGLPCSPGHNARRGSIRVRPSGRVSAAPVTGTAMHSATSTTSNSPGRCAGPERCSCATCSLLSGCLPRALDDARLREFSDFARLKRKLHHGQTLFASGERMTALYVVRSGTLKTLTVSRIGQQKITGFYLPGDIIGLDAISSEIHPYDAVALEDSEVCVLPMHQLEAMAARVPALQKQLLRALSEDISKDHGLMLLLGSMDAEQRVGTLLLSLAERYSRLGYAREALLLHMTREEIASYLGLSSETVSRVMSRLQERGLLAVHQRHVEFKNPERLLEASAW